MEVDHSRTTPEEKRDLLALASNADGNVRGTAIVQDTEKKTVDPLTGGQKGTKLARFSLIPRAMLYALAEHYGKNTPEFGGKYPERNWEKGYAWHLSADALERHWNKWLMGESYDDETGTHHLICVIWHATALYVYQFRGLGNNDIRTQELAHDEPRV